MANYARMYNGNQLLSVKMIDLPPYPTERMLVRTSKKVFGITKRSISTIVCGLDGQYLHINITGSKLILIVDVPIYHDDDD